MPKTPPPSLEQQILHRLSGIEARLRAIEISQNEFTGGMNEVMTSVEAVKAALDASTIIDEAEPTDPPGDVDFTKWLSAEPANPKRRG